MFELMAEEMNQGGVMSETKKKVMVAIDESDYSYDALMWVLENLKESITTKQLVIFATQPAPIYSSIFAASLSSARMYAVAAGAPQLVNSIQENHKKVTLCLLEKAKAICTSKGINAETITEVGDAKVVICDAVQKYNIDLLVMGHRGMGKLKRAIIGSVSNYCVQNAKCPVLVVKKSE